MKVVAMIISMSVAVPALAGSAKVVYGRDNRIEYHQASSKLKSYADKVPAMIPKTELDQSLTGYTLKPSKTIGEVKHLCPSERFSDQPTSALCSGFLVAPNWILTAGHCVESEYDCSSNAWVFGYKTNSNGEVNKHFSEEQVYNCKSILKQKFTGSMDYALIELDRDVKGVTPFKVRGKGAVSSSQELVVIGYPSALPQKIAAEGRVIDNATREYFTTNLDTFQGNSGSPVIDYNTGVVEGILVRGKTDYVTTYEYSNGIYQSCSIVNVCSSSGKCIRGDRFSRMKGEEVTRITAVLDDLGKN